MNRVKLIVSDFHLGVGRRNPDGSINIMEDFILDDRFVDFIEYYSTGDYTNSEVELIINGDFFNMIQGEVEGQVPSEVTEEVAAVQLSEILDGHPKVVSALRQFAELPDKHLTFTVGNHDAGLAFAAVKHLLKERLGESVKIYNRAYIFDNVHVEHGDRYEPVHYVDAKLPFLSKGLKNPILNFPWATFFFIHYVRKIKRQRPYIDKVKPFRNFLVWAAIFDFSFFLYTIFRLVPFVLYSAFFGAIGHKRFGLKIFATLIKQFSAEPEMKAARRILQKKDVHTVIFGHTHHPLHRLFQPGKQYFNTGCWNGQTNLDIKGMGHQTHLVYAYLKWTDQGWLTRLRRWHGRARMHDEFSA